MSAGLLSGTGRVNGALSVGNGGVVRVSDGEILNVNSIAASTNSGTISTGGELDFSNALNNGSRILGRGTLRASQITNAGTITVSAGVSDVFGSLTNNNGAKTIVTGGSTSTFYSPVTNIAGSEFRVSTGSTAVFLSDVIGLAAFTGPGVKDFEAGTASFAGINSNSGTTIVGADAKLNAAFVRDAALIVEGTANILPNGTASGTSRVGTLSIVGAPAAPTGTLDLNDNDLIASATPKSYVEATVASRAEPGAWDRPDRQLSAARQCQRLNGAGGAQRAGVHELRQFALRRVRGERR